MTARLATTILLMVLVAAPGARASSCAPLQGSFDYTGYGPELELMLGSIATLPMGSTILAGQYHDGAQTVHPALLVDQEGNGDWVRVPLPTHGADVGHLTTAGTDTAWAVVQFRREGLELPVSILRSRDGGQSWCAVPFDGLETLNTAESLRFYDRDHGIIVFSEAPFGDRRSVYQTSDGGDSWQRVWNDDPAPPSNIESDYAYPQDQPPPHAPTWRLESGLYRISGLLRIRTEVEHQVIERLDFSGGQDWFEIDRLSRYRPTDDLASGR